MDLLNIYFKKLNKLAVIRYQFPCIISVFILNFFPPGSAFNMRIRIQEGK